MLSLDRYTADYSGTYGVFVWEKRPICHTFELPWIKNRPQISCIPEGQYSARKVVSDRYGDCFFVDGVPDRYGILIHPGNTSRDTKGCILPGLDVDYEFGGVLNSRLAMKRLYAILPSNFYLTVRYI